MSKYKVKTGAFTALNKGDVRADFFRIGDYTIEELAGKFPDWFEAIPEVEAIKDALNND